MKEDVILELDRQQRLKVNAQRDRKDKNDKPIPDRARVDKGNGHEGKESKNATETNPQSCFKRYRPNFNFRFCACLYLAWLMVGIIGYKFLLDIDWLLSWHNSTLILCGLGPAVAVKTTGAILFEIFYCSVNLLIYTTIISKLVTPMSETLIQKVEEVEGH